MTILEKEAIKSDFLQYKGVDTNLVNAKTSKKGGRNGR